jgi:hypothetical protein
LESYRAEKRRRRTARQGRRGSCLPQRDGEQRSTDTRIEHDQALNRAMQALLRDNTELFKRFSDDPEFKRWLADMSFAESYDPEKHQRE